VLEEKGVVYRSSLLNLKAMKNLGKTQWITTGKRYCGGTDGGGRTFGGGPKVASDREIKTTQYGGLKLLRKN